MVRDVARPASFCRISPEEAALLASPQAPIVLLRRRADPTRRARRWRRVAPGNPRLGVMLPTTPLHHLLLAAVDFPLVATSGNLSDEPIAIDDAEALVRLGGIADLFLVHDRPIARHVDDSVAWLVDGAPQLLRRARGYAPLPLLAERELPCLVAAGAHQKATAALSVGDQIFLSQHIGDMETPEAHAAFERVIARLSRPLRSVAGRDRARPPSRLPDDALGGARGARRRRPARARRTAAAGAAAASRCSITTPTSPPVSPSTTRPVGCPARRSDSASTAPATAPTAPSGAARPWSRSWPTAPTARRFRGFRPAPAGSFRARPPAPVPPARAARRRCASRGASPSRCCTSSKAQELSRGATFRPSPPFRRPDERRCWAECSRPGGTLPGPPRMGRLFDGVAALVGVGGSDGLGARVSFEAEAAMALEFAANRRSVAAILCRWSRVWRPPASLPDRSRTTRSTSSTGGR